MSNPIPDPGLRASAIVELERSKGWTFYFEPKVRGRIESLESLILSGTKKGDELEHLIERRNELNDLLNGVKGDLASARRESKT